MAVSVEGRERESFDVESVPTVTKAVTSKQFMALMAAFSVLLMVSRLLLKKILRSGMFPRSANREYVRSEGRGGGSHSATIKHWLSHLECSSDHRLCTWHKQLR